MLLRLVKYQHKRQLHRLMNPNYLEDSLKRKDLSSERSKTKYQG